MQNGAEIVENPLPNNPSCLCVAGERTFKVEAIIKKKAYNIVTLNWFLKSIDKQIIALKPYDMLVMTSEVEETFKDNFDCYGDSYTELCTIEDLKELLENISEEQVNCLNLYSYFCIFV